MWVVIEESFEFPEVIGEFASRAEALAFRARYLAACDWLCSEWVWVERA